MVSSQRRPITPLMALVHGQNTHGDVTPLPDVRLISLYTSLAAATLRSRIHGHIPQHIPTFLPGRKIINGGLVIPVRSINLFPLVGQMLDHGLYIQPISAQLHHRTAIQSCQSPHHHLRHVPGHYEIMVSGIIYHQMAAHVMGLNHLDDPDRA